MKLIATKPLTYATRRLLAGDTFDAMPMHGRLLVAIKKARDPNNGVLAGRSHRMPLARQKTADSDPAAGEEAKDAGSGAGAEAPPADDVSLLTRTPRRRGQ